MIDNDIREMFYKKNKEIIINKLVLDFKNNMDSLEATILNITYLEFAIYSQKILDIDKNLKNKKQVEKWLSSFESKLNSDIKKLMEEKKKNCVSYISSMDIDNDLNSYEEQLSSSTEVLSGKLSWFFQDYIEKEVLSKLISNEWYLRNDKKIRFFFQEKLGKDLLKKIISQFKDRDVIIFNNARESYEKYLSLNANFE